LGAVAFWSAAIAFSVLFFLRQRAVDKAREKAQQLLISEANRLQDLIQTLPPAGFLSEFDRVLSLAQNAVAKLASSPERTAQTVDHTIRVVLDSVVTLAKLFDGSPYGVTYAGNIMLFRETEKMSDEDLTEIRKRLHFVDDDLDIHNLLGVLDLEISLSTTTEARGESDTSLVPLALPLPSAARTADGRRWRVLPGAPMAFYTRILEAYVDAATLGKWCREQGDFTESVCCAIEAYFGSPAGMQVRSLAAVTLERADQSQPIGVLNLHRDRPGLLEKRQAGEQFFPLMRPFRSLCIQLLEVRETVSELPSDSA
jgi:hypothetical protein